MSILVDLKLPPLPEPLPRPVIDAHTHLDSTQKNSHLPVPDALEFAARVGVTGVVHVGCNVVDAAWAVETAQSQPQVISCVAIHPSTAANLPDRLDADIDEIERLCQAPGVRAVGETGLDYHWTKDREGKGLQQHSFRRHIALAKTYDKTLVIHDRDAHADIVAILDEEGWPQRVVMHCFSGDAEFGALCLSRGAWLSFPGNISYKANEHLREALAAAPADKILVETDAPYLTPVPHRGRSNASYLIPHTVRLMSDVTTIPLADLCDHLWYNAEAAFGGAWCDR